MSFHVCTGSMFFCQFTFNLLWLLYSCLTVASWSLLDWKLMTAELTFCQSVMTQAMVNQWRLAPVSFICCRNC